MTKYNHIMLDFETLGLGSCPVIVSVGACRFNPVEGTIGDTYHALVDLESYKSFPAFKVDLSTVQWWFNQSEEARASNFGGDSRLSIERAINSLFVFFKGRLVGSDHEPVLWSNGATADIVWLTNAIKALSEVRKDISWPWSYKNERCFRTLKEVTRGTEWATVAQEAADQLEGVAHDALYDAVWQATYATNVLHEMGKDSD